MKKEIIKMVNRIINNNINNIDEIINNYNGDNKMLFLNEVIKELSRKNYEIISLSPLKIEKK